MRKRIKYQNSHTNVRADYMDTYNGTPLSLTDTFPVGSLKGCTVKEAIDFSPNQVDHMHGQGKIKLDGPAIKYLVAVEFNRKSKIKNG